MFLHLPNKKVSPAFVAPSGTFFFRTKKTRSNGGCAKPVRASLGVAHTGADVRSCRSHRERKKNRHHETPQKNAVMRNERLAFRR